MESASLEAQVASHFADSAKLKVDAAKLLSAPIARGIALMAASLKAGGKILACGNGGSAADAQHFAAELVNRFERERPPLAGLALTTDSSALTSIANDYSYEQVFEKQLRALGRGGGKMAEHLAPGDVHVCVPHERTMRIQEVHLLVLHCL